MDKVISLSKTYLPPAAAATLGGYGAKMLGGPAWVQIGASIAGGAVGLWAYAKFIK